MFTDDDLKRLKDNVKHRRILTDENCLILEALLARLAFQITNAI